MAVGRTSKFRRRKGISVPIGRVATGYLFACKRNSAQGKWRINLTEPLLTRAEAIEIIKRELGIPVAKRTLDRAAINGTGPTPKAKYGHAFLYEKDAVLSWAQTLITVLGTEAP